MATPRIIKGVLWNFLGTYTSRYSDYEGYWLFGFLVVDLNELNFKLLEQNLSDSHIPLGMAALSAKVRFEAQVQKAGLTRSQVKDAWLKIRRLPNAVEGSVNGHPCTGYKVSFLAGAVMDNSKRYERERVVFVAPHNAKVELRSARAAESGAGCRALGSA